MQFSGQEQFAISPERLWDRVTDLDFMAKCIPGMQQIDRSEPQLLACRVRPDFSFLTGSLRVTLEIVDLQPPRTAQMRVHGKAIGASTVVLTSIEIHSEDKGARLDWQSEISERTGMLKTISRGLIEGAARKVTETAWAAFRVELDRAESS
jgi:carbon monoxide dehydrogenase subunit G